MTDETTNLVLEHLRHIRDAVDALRFEVREQRDRSSALDGQVAALRRDVADVLVNVASINVRLDRSNDRAERIEQRLGLVDV